MTVFFRKFCLFALPILVIGLSMETLLRNIPNDYLRKNDYLNKNSSKIETLILGSSHSFYGVKPAYFTMPTFNASHISQSLNYDFAILQKYENELKSLKTIVLPISYFSLFVSLDEESEAWRIKNYLIYYDLNISKPYALHTELLSNRFDINLKRIYSYYMLGKPSAFSSKLGWGTNYKSNESRDLIKTGKSAVQRHTRDVEATKNIFKENVRMLESLLEWCKNEDVRLVLFTPPAFRSYSNGLNKRQIDLTVQTAADLDMENGNCIYFNLLNDTRFEQNDFFDADHLAETGALKLSTILNEKLMNWK